MIRRPSPPWLVLCIDSGAVEARCSDVWMLGGLGVVVFVGAQLARQEARVLQIAATFVAGVVHTSRNFWQSRSWPHLLHVVWMDITNFWHDWKPDMTSENQNKMRNDPIVALDNTASAHQNI